MELTAPNGDVDFTDVDFGYTPQKQVLFDIDINTNPGQKIAFVGGTGAGKTTIINLINRFYEIQKGKILYDGIPLTDIRKESLRKRTSSQAPFSTTSVTAVWALLMKTAWQQPALWGLTISYAVLPTVIRPCSMATVAISLKVNAS